MMAAKATDSDTGSLTPSEQSDGEERSEHDSDYETDEEEEDKNKGSGSSNVVWTGFGRKTPVIVFKVEGVLQKKPDLKTIGERYHLAFKFGTTECKIVRNILTSHGFHEVHPNSSDFNLLWTNAHLKPFTLRSMTEFQKINHFPRSYELTRKDRLFKNVQRMQQIKGQRHFDFIPNSFVLPGEYQDFCAAFLREKGHWIVKPVASSRGRGVFLINHPDQIPLDENIIVCKYLGNPLLVDGFKFDVRLYIAVTSYDPLTIYLFEEGLTRFATVKYEKSNKHIRNQCMHLTNYSVNKKSQDYVRNDDPDVEDYGNKWSLGALLRYLRSQGRDTAALMMRIEDVIIKTIISVELPIATACKMFMPHRGNCFELYGFDILIDDNLKPWVLEVNLSPSLACDSPLDLKIKANMLCDLFSLAGVACHDPMMRNMQQSRRNQEVASKMAARAKSARTRPVSATTRQRPLSAGPANSAVSGKDKNANKNMGGLNSEEIKIIRRSKEEEQRKGGWVKIFPTADSWEIYSPFLQFNSTHNLMLHQRLYPERHKGNLGKLATAGATSLGSRSRTGYLQITGAGQTKSENDHRHVEAYAQAMIRTRQYERRLGHKRRRSKNKNKKKARVSNKKEPKSKLVQGVPEDLEEDQVSEEESANQQKTDPSVTQEEKVEPVESVEPLQMLHHTQPIEAAAPEAEVKVISPHQPSPPTEEEKAMETKCEEAEPEAVPKYNVVELLLKGGSLSKVQARSAFAMYLVRVQQRLISDTGALSQEDVEALNEQMDLVLRFLKRAAVNLQQSFKVIVPSRKLPLSDRRRILAKQLGDFVHIYNKETEQLRTRKMIDRRHLRRTDSMEGLHESKFEKFVNTACEAELEEVLTTYTKMNKSASIFLGSNAKTSSDSQGASAGMVRSDSSLVKRRESSDLQDSNWEEVPRVCSASNADIRYESGGSHSLPRPASAHLAPPSSYNNAVSIYSQKLTRPRSALVSNQKTGVYVETIPFTYVPNMYGEFCKGGRPPFARPSSATVHSRPSSASTYITSEPTVDTYNEEAIHDALQRLAIRQQTRQYSAFNGTSALQPDQLIHHLTTPTPSRPGSATHSRKPSESLLNGGEFTDSSSSSNMMSQPGRRQEPGQPLQRYLTMEEQIIRSRPSSSSGSNRPRADYKVSGKHGKANVNMDNANATFNSFIDDPGSQWQSDLMAAYSQVTGVQPQNYQNASANSRQYHLAQQQHSTKQQRLMEQSKALLEQSKAKHQAMVAQAHAAQRTLSYTEPAEVQPGKQTFTPKPPIQPAGGRRMTPAHRLARTPSNDEGNLNFNFYNSLKYDIHTGQIRTWSGDGW
ncbi:tubulin polyglutamylase TTLL5-like isoform X1 [Haliotis cracherodii]|uniref:tubulin polyglutamylase TTLL5-like isoform X1 n=1 Tax=Haliotis cracherodii TaxID=6455 RepID=UPI0039E894D3